MPDHDDDADISGAAALATARSPGSHLAGPSPLATDDARAELTAGAGGADVELWLTLDATASAPARARAAVRDCAIDLERENLRVLELLVSELVTNSVRHAATGRAGEIRILIMVDADMRHVAVTDRGPGFEHPQPPRSHETGGFGLVIVDRLATRWGTTHGGRRVWFELPRHGRDGARQATITSAPGHVRAPRRLGNRRRVAIGIASVAIAGLAGVLAGELIGNTGARPIDGTAPAASSVAAASGRAADERDIQARAIAYQAALDPGGASDPCDSMAVGAAARALLSADAEPADGCKAAVRARDEGIASSSPAGVTNIRFVSVIDINRGRIPGARATWASDPNRTVGFVRERGRWVVAE